MKYSMPRKKKSKEVSETEFVFDYRYTPKLYFTAPVSPASNKVSSSDAQKQPKMHVSKAMNPNPTIVKDSDGLTQNRNSVTSLENSGPAAGQASGKFNTPKNSSSALARSSVEPTRSQFGLYDIASSISKGPVFPGEKQFKNAIDFNRSKMQDMFTDMYRGKIDPAVIEIVLSEANWDENQALDALSQLVPHDEAHASQSRDDCLDRRTTIEGDEVHDSNLEGNRKGRVEQFDRPDALFLQYKKSQLADVLDFCPGDENWAMNVLLDSNSLNVPKPKKKKKCADRRTTIYGDEVGAFNLEGKRKSRVEEVDRLHARFPQYKKSQLADVLDFCHGDGNCAMNLLLDYNSLKVPKPKKKKSAGLRLLNHKKLKLKVRSEGKTKGRALQSCLGDRQPAYCYQRLSKDTAVITFSPEMITELLDIIGVDSETSTAMESAPMKVSLPKWIGHRMYRCLMESIYASKDTDNKFEKVLSNTGKTLWQKNEAST